MAAAPSRFRQADFHVVLPGYFEAMKTRLIAGRTFADADNHAEDPKAGAPRHISRVLRDKIRHRPGGRATA